MTQAAKQSAQTGRAVDLPLGNARITDVRTMLLLGPDPHGVGGLERSWHVVPDDMDAGVYGLGEAGNFFGDRQAIA